MTETDWFGLDSLETKARQRVGSRPDINQVRIEALELTWDAETFAKSGDSYHADEAMIRAGYLYRFADMLHAQPSTTETR